MLITVNLLDLKSLSTQDLIRLSQNANGMILDLIDEKGYDLSFPEDGLLTEDGELAVYLETDRNGQPVLALTGDDAPLTLIPWTDENRQASPSLKWDTIYSSISFRITEALSSRLEKLTVTDTK